MSNTVKYVFIYIYTYIYIKQNISSNVWLSFNAFVILQIRWAIGEKDRVVVPI